MQQSLFSKYFSVCSTIILAAIIFLGTIFMMLVGQYFQMDKFELLNRNLRQAANVTVTNYQLNNYAGVTQNTILPIYTVLGNAIDADIYLTDLEGNTLICSHGSNCNHLANQIDSQIMSQALKGGFQEISNMGFITAVIIVRPFRWRQAAQKSVCFSVPFPQTQLTLFSLK